MQVILQSSQDKTLLQDMVLKHTRKVGQSIQQLIQALKMQQKRECLSNCFYMIKDTDGGILQTLKAYLLKIR